MVELEEGDIMLWQDDSLAVKQNGPIDTLCNPEVAKNTDCVTQRSHYLLQRKEKEKKTENRLV